MAGSVTLDYSDGEFVVLMYDAEGMLVDVYEVFYDNFTLTKDAAVALMGEAISKATGL